MKNIVVNEEVEITVLPYFEAHREFSIRDATKELELSYSSVQRILKTHKYILFKFSISQTLQPGHSARRLAFCHWFVNFYDENLNGAQCILWSDETNFSNRGMFNKKNSHYWSQENLLIVRPHAAQVRFSFNVWCGLIGSVVVGPVYYNDCIESNEETFKVRKKKKDFIRDEETEVNVLAYFETNPEKSIRRYIRELELKKSTVLDMLIQHKLRPHKHHKVQTLLPADANRRLGFCNWLRSFYNERPDNLNYDCIESNEETFKVRKKKKDFIRDEETEVNVLAYFETNPEKSIRRYIRELELKKSTVLDMLIQHKLRPHKHHKVQTLLPADANRRLGFCNWLRSFYNERPDNLNYGTFYGLTNPTFLV
ncbi:transposable element tc3 transposase-like protein [Holotrichia oblita]|uniref:Transposable element tc3 transposase-like protein n=1 Tax=Holotrichia oblita TaxID=644536 RepID=A0ACB9TN07_HOLOL|nr:transposable element tc3 transposase-like protein [Holotrichia oblita]